MICRRHLICFLCLFLGASPVFAQKDSIPKYDTQWIVESYQHIIFDFNNGKRDIKFLGKVAKDNLGFQPTLLNFLFSDRDGNPLFYFSGCQLFGLDGTLIEGAENFNIFSEQSDIDCSDFDFAIHNLAQAYIIPVNDTLFHVIHKIFDEFSDNIDESEYYGMTKIIINNLEKPEIIAPGKILFKTGEMFVKKNNDLVRSVEPLQWWIVGVPNLNNSGYILKYDVYTESLLDTLTWELPYPYSNNNAISSELKFSPDGNWLMLHSFTYGTYIYRFDRESGELDLAHYIPLNEYRARTRSGSFYASFGPQSRYVFWNENDRVFRYDLLSEHIIESRTLVAKREFSSSVLPTAGFGLSQLAPDCQIYYNGWWGEDEFHVLENPWSEYDVFMNQEIFVDTFNTGRYFPRSINYRIDLPWDALCDTTTSTLEYGPQEEALQLKVYPNPGGDQIFLEADKNCHQFTLNIFNQVGESTMKFPNYRSGTAINVSGLSSGMYFLQAENCDGTLMSAKWIKL